jgi:endonuclease/exonuclease/phosphatase family metal-dependent hydrolase
MPSLRLIAWNCHHGSVSTCLSELARYSPDVVFLQECTPTGTLPSTGQFAARQVNARKGIALGSPHAGYRLTKTRSRANAGQAFVCASVRGPVSFTALGIWGQTPHYVNDVMRTLDAYDAVLRSGPSVVMGDLNSGTDLNKPGDPSSGHARILAKMTGLGLISAYHAFHRVAHGREVHPTYRHLRNARRPWHIDFCFVPASWEGNLRRVDVIDGDDWAGRSDHLPLKIDCEFVPR